MEGCACDRHRVRARLHDKVVERYDYELPAPVETRVRHIGEAVGLTSPSTVHNHLNTLQRLGFLRRDPTKPRAIEMRYDSSSGAPEDERGERLDAEERAGGRVPRTPRISTKPLVIRVLRSSPFPPCFRLGSTANKAKKKGGRSRPFHDAGA